MRRRDDTDPMAAFATMQAGYQAAKRSGPFKRRRAGIPPQGAGADWHFSSDSDYLWMGEIARDLDRNDPVIGQLIDRHVDNVVGCGFSCNPNTGDPGLDEALKERWKEESVDPYYCDVAGELTFHDQEQMVVREMAVPGDVLALPIGGGESVQLLESHLCRSPSKTTKNIVLGVEMEADTRRRVRYWLTKEPIDPLARKVLLRDLNPVPAYTEDDEANVFHVYRPKRPTQTRGVTALAPVIDMAGLHDDLQFAALLKAQLSAFFLLVKNRGEHFEPTGDQTPSGVPTTDPTGYRSQQKLAPGAELVSQKGEQIQPWAPNIPNAEFFPHVKLVLTFLGINLGMPLVLVLLDASETNFSGYRGAIDQARLGFRRIQRQLIQRFHRPYWRMKVRYWGEDDAALAAAIARSKTGGAIDAFRHTWKPPGWPYIEPSKDAATNIARLANLQTSPSRLMQEQGDEWAEIVAETVRDRAAAIREAVKESQAINQEFKLEGPAAVNWRDLAPLPNAERVAISMQVGEEAEKPEPANAKRAA